MKITKYILSLATAVGMIAGCQKAELVQMLPAEDIVAPVLADLPESIVITPKNMAIDTVEFVWTKADFGAPTQVTYALEVSEANGDKKAVISSGITDTTAVVLYEAINVALYEGLELPDGVASAVNFFVSAYTGESAKVYSAPVAVTVTPTAAEKTYPMIYMPGSYQDWKPDQAPAKFQVLYDFTGTGVFEGIADFITSPDESRAWKFTPEPDWDFDWGIPKDATPEAEAAEVTLINNDGGERDNINIYTAKRFYHFTMDTNTGLLKHNYSFDQVGVVGELTGWADGADKVMEFNAAKRRFYVDVEGLKGMFKFRLDGKWDKSWGASDFDVEVSNGDGNLEAEEGNYRVYLYLSNSGALAYELSASMYGKEEPVGGNVVEPEEPTTPEAPVMTGWGLVGTINNWGNLIEGENKYIADTPLANDGTWYVAKAVEFAEAGEVKIRLDGKWDTSFGLAADVTFAADTELAVTSDNGANIAVPAGTYDIYFNPETAKVWFITDGTYPGGGAAKEDSPWALIGEFNSWAGDYPMVIEGQYHVAYGFTLAADGKLKFRKDGQWNYKDESGAEIQTNLGGAVFAADAELPLTAGGADIVVTAGTYDVYLSVAEDGQSGKAYFMTPGKTPVDAGAAPEVPETPETPEITESAIAADVVATEEDSEYGVMGSFNTWGGDILMKKTTDANVFVAAGVEFTAEGEFKVRTAGTWDAVNLGLQNDGAALEANKAYAVVDNGKNLKVAAGTYDIWVHMEKKQVYIMEAGIHPSTAGEGAATPPAVEDLSGEAWYLVGTLNGWNVEDTTYQLVKGEKWMSCTNVEFTGDECKFKVHTDNSWGVNRGGAFAAVGSPIDVFHDGSDIVVPAGTYDIYMNFTATKLYVMAPGEVPAE